MGQRSALKDRGLYCRLRREVIDVVDTSRVHLPEVKMLRMLLFLLVIVSAVVTPALGSSQPSPATFETARPEALARLRTGDPDGALEVLGRALSPLDAREKALFALLKARALVATNRPKEALVALEAAGSNDVPGHLRGVIDEEIAIATGVAGGPGARAVLRTFLSKNPSSPRSTEVRMALARLALAEGDSREAYAVAGLVLSQRKGPSRSIRAEALLLQAKARSGASRAAVLRRIFIDLPETSAAAATGLTEQALSTGELERRSNAFFGAIDYEEAQRIREALWTSGHRSPRLALQLAMSHLSYVRDDAARALTMLGEAEAGGALKKPDSHLLFARAKAKLEDYDGAMQHYRAYLNQGGRRDRAKALYYLAWLPYDHGDYQVALPALERYLREIRHSDQRSYVAWFRAWSLYRLKRWPEAIAAFEAMLPMGNSLVAGKAMYWGGMAYRALSNNEEAGRWMRRAIDRYPLTYYSVLAAKRLKEWEGVALPEWMTGPSPGLPEPAPLWPFDRLASGPKAALQRVKDLSEAGEIDRARRSYAPIARSVERAVKKEERARFLLTIHDALEDYHVLFQRAAVEFRGLMSAVPTPGSAIYWMALYPRAQRSLVRVLAERFGMSELWAYAIMRQESRYDARQVSNTAALGMMQMIPSTARKVSKALDVPFDVESFFAPERNLRFCTWFLAALFTEFKQQILFASAAYNSGAPAIKRFLARSRELPFDEMVESIAYNEGRNYARKVAEHLSRYAYLHLPPEERAVLYAKLFPDTVDYDVGTAMDY